ncbi:FKBP-type peptidyl-prolyl cis-trans isomerase [Enhygromyxa salina]|uniref:Putative FKBP-type peptidyl-prolyl cis-trans isomerase n=1 Tax=Enhygromyxa salina TaxID=215803 RepID=A0A2S9YN75_9BACT|nr:hypothetical protein [Enhygromyxa salina]PRQ06532.1 putative FKBP-type peptidyl-prolyl cis-trans isomerase [Enhygromyxa salina]
MRRSPLVPLLSLALNLLACAKQPAPREAYEGAPVRAAINPDCDAETLEGVRGLPCVQIDVFAEGEGPSARDGEWLKVHYIVLLPNGSVLDSSHDRGKPLSVQLNQSGDRRSYCDRTEAATQEPSRLREQCGLAGEQLRLPAEATALAHEGATEPVRTAPFGSRAAVVLLRGCRGHAGELASLCEARWVAADGPGRFAVRGPVARRHLCGRQGVLEAAQADLSSRATSRVGLSRS